MAGITKHDQKSSHRLDTLLSIPVERRAAEKLAVLARKERITRTEFVRAIIMRALEPEEATEAAAS